METKVCTGAGMDSSSLCEAWISPDRTLMWALQDWKKKVFKLGGTPSSHANHVFLKQMQNRSTLTISTDFLTLLPYSTLFSDFSIEESHCYYLCHKMRHVSLSPDIELEPPVLIKWTQVSFSSVGGAGVLAEVASGLNPGLGPIAACLSHSSCLLSGL